MIVLGNKRLLENKLALALNSSQSKSPCGNDSWVKGIVKAIPELLAQDHTIISSLGLLTWEIPIHVVRESDGNQVIMSPVFDDSNGEIVFRKTISDFGLDENKVAMIFVKPGRKTRSPKENWGNRDKAAMALAQRIFPISIRPGGRLDKMLSNEPAEKLSFDYKVDYAKPISRAAIYDLRGHNQDFPEWPYITHWTKTRFGPWPGERKLDFLSRLLGSGDSYPGKAFDTLLRIIKDKRLKASADKMRENRAAVGFTEASPQQALTLMRWCPKRVNWNFEPYGIAIKKELASSLGARPVIYGDDDDYKSIPENEKPYFQSRGSTDVDWSREREWRHLGDLDFSKVAEDTMLFLVWQKKEADYLAGNFGVNALALSNL